METANHLEPGEGWGETGGEAWARLQSLLELVRQEHHRAELSPERREQLRERVLARWQKYERRRRRWRVFVAGACAVIVFGVARKLVARARAA